MDSAVHDFPNDEDIMYLAGALLDVSRDRSEKSGGVIDYTSFAEVRRKLSERPVVAKYLTPVLYMKMPKDANGCISTDMFMHFLDTKIEYERLYIQLKKYGSTQDGFLRESEVQSFVLDTVPNLKGLDQLEEEFIPFYAFGATKKFLFHLDPRKTGKVSLEDLVVSPHLRDFMELRHGPIDKSCWFSAEASMQTYSHYLEIDEENDGMLSLKELSKCSTRWILTPAAVQRIFEENLSFNNKLDYRGYLDLVLALDNPDCISAKRYMWTVLNGNAPLGWSDLMFFLSSLIECLKSRTNMTYKLPDLSVEFMDMLQKNTNEKVQFHDIRTHKNGGLFLKMLIDANAFYSYDNRESLLLTAHQTDSH